MPPFLLLAAALGAGGDPACVALADTVVAVVAREHPGWAERDAAAQAMLRDEADGLRREAAAADGTRCPALIARWLGRLDDPHLALVPPAGAPPPVTERPPARETRPSLSWRDDTTAVLRLPSFALAVRGAVDSLLAASWDRLTRAQVLVVDVRGNGGGCDCTYDRLRDLLYTGPVRVAGAEVWATPGAIAQYEAWAADPRQAADFRAMITRALPALRRGVGGWVPLVPAQVYRRPRVLARPARVEVLADSGCASSCEDFLAEARQSAKAVLAQGLRTAGATQYGNVRTVPLPEGYRLRVATTRAG
ncbi:MAG: hypothetical protein KBF47_07830 [Gemmatimonadales bacterium]|nr:hypothetical protein [Gemmatimonadales bacterium]